MQRANWLGAPAAFNLNQACLTLSEAFGWGHTFLVGSAIERRDFRDVDVRVILDDAEYDRMFPNQTDSRAAQHDAYWSLLCSSVSEWLASRTGLPIDFQIQRRTQANEKFQGKRQALGIFLRRE